MIEMSSTNKSDSETTFELTTLTNIIELSNQCIKFLDLLQVSRRQILLDIKNNENNFFEQNPLIISQFNSLFDPTLYKSKVKAFVEELEDSVEVYCCHEYIEDIIDIDYDQSKRVVYCQLCELTKR
jgi:hypothetical protein